MASSRSWRSRRRVSRPEPDHPASPCCCSTRIRARWDQLLIRRGLAALDRAEAQAKALGQPLDSYVLQAAIAACHARARSSAETDWTRIVGLYGRLAELTLSPVVELNRAVALGMLFGPAAGLELVDALTGEPSLKDYHLLPGVRGDLLMKLGRHEEARAEFERAAALTRNSRERALLLDRAAACLADATAPREPMIDNNNKYEVS